MIFIGWVGVLCMILCDFIGWVGVGWLDNEGADYYYFFFFVAVAMAGGLQ